jgi:hypothetical protein
MLKVGQVKYFSFRYRVQTEISAKTEGLIITKTETKISAATEYIQKPKFFDY